MRDSRNVTILFLGLPPFSVSKVPTAPVPPKGEGGFPNRCDERRENIRGGYGVLSWHALVLAVAGWIVSVRCDASAGDAFVKGSFRQRKASSGHQEPCFFKFDITSYRVLGPISW